MFAARPAGRAPFSSPPRPSSPRPARRGRGVPPHKIIALFLCAIALAGCEAKPPDTLHYTGPTMGTYYSIKVVPPRDSGTGDDVDVERLGRDVRRILEEIDGRMSTYRADSPLSRFNASDSTDWFPVPEDLYTVVAEALRVGRLTGGAFDVTVGPLVNLWGFGPPMEESGEAAGGSAAGRVGNAVAGEAAIRRAMARIGYEKVHARPDPPALRKDHPGVYLDLSAIAKGFAVDRVAEYLTGEGLANHLVDVGGELRGQGGRGRPWRVGIERPAPGKRTVHRVITLDGHAVATSGDYRNFFERDGRRYSHTIDPRTGRPVTHRLASVTVIDPSAMRADAMATAISVLGPEAGYRLAEREGIPAWLITKTEAGFVDRRTPGFAGFVVSE